MTAEKRIRILVADENSIFRRGLGAVLAAKERFRVVGLADEAEEVRRKAAELKPDVVVLDLEAGQPRLDLLLSLARECPSIRVLAIGEAADMAVVEEAFRAGAAGYLLRSARDEEFWQAIEAVHRGETYLTASSRKLIERCLARRGAPGRGSRRLTVREREILRLIAEGMSNKEVATALAISVRTVENHRASIMKKLDLRSVVDLVKYAISSGLVRLERR